MANLPTAPAAARPKVTRLMSGRSPTPDFVTRIKSKSANTATSSRQRHQRKGGLAKDGHVNGDNGKDSRGKDGQGKGGQDKAPTPAPAAMQRHNDGDHGGSHMEVDDEDGALLTSLCDTAQHRPDALDAFRQAWNSRQPSSAIPTSTLEDHEMYDDAVKALQPIFTRKYLDTAASRDVRGFFSKIRKCRFGWHEELGGLRFYALFGHEGCSRTFLHGLRQLEEMRCDDDSSASEADDEDDEEEEDNEKGLTFLQAWELLVEARTERVTASTVRRGVSKRDEWRPVDCETAAKLAAQRFGMRSKTKPKSQLRKRKPDTEETHHEGGDSDHCRETSQEHGAGQRADGNRRQQRFDNEDDNDDDDDDDDDNDNDSVCTPEKGRREWVYSRSPAATPNFAFDDPESPRSSSRLPRTQKRDASTSLSFNINTPTPTRNWACNTDATEHSIEHGPEFINDDDSFSLPPVTPDRETMGPRPAKRRASHSPGRNPGPISSFRQQHFTDLEDEEAPKHRRHLELMTQFLASILPQPGPKLLEVQDLIVASDITNPEANASFVVGIVAPRGHASWSVIYIDLVNQTKPSLAIHADHVAEADIPDVLTRLSPWLKDTLPQALVQRIRAIPTDEYNMVNLPRTLDLQPQHMPESLLKSLAVAVFLFANCDIPPGIFLWAWIGAMSTASAQHVRISEFQRSVELPDLGAQQEPAFDAALQGQAQAESMAAFDHGLRRIMNRVEVLQRQIATLASFACHLEHMGRCFRDDVYSGHRSARGDAVSRADLDKQLNAVKNMLGVTGRNDPLYGSLEQRVQDLEEQKESLSTETPAHARVLRELSSWSALSRGDANNERLYRVEQRNELVTSLQAKMKEAQDRLCDLSKSDGTDDV